MSDPVNPDHYVHAGIDAIEVLHLNGQAEHFAIGNVLKYVMRAKAKNVAEDYKKARWYLNYLIASSGKARTWDEIEAYCRTPHPLD